MAEVVQENPEFKEKFLAVNRNWKTEHGEEVGGQWAKQILEYLVVNRFYNCEWLIDLGGKSGTLYHLEGNIFVKKKTVFNDTAPNALVDTPTEFNDYFKLEIDKLRQAGIDITKLAVLQTGIMREKNIQGVFSNSVGFHQYLPKEIESKYEAIDFMRTVLRTNEASSFSLTPVKDYKIRVTPEPRIGIITQIWYSLIYTLFG